jgi:predicted CoA-binding protein
MSEPSPSDAIGRQLAATKRVAVIGWSPDPGRPSARIAAYLERAGFAVAHVNPRAPGAYATLAEVPKPVDLVVVFRRSEEAPAHVEEAIAAGARGVWLQEGVTTRDGAARCAGAGIFYLEDRCVMVEHRVRGL